MLFRRKNTRHFFILKGGICLELTDKELLQFAVENGMIDVNDVRKQIEMNEKKEILKAHSSKIWQSSDNKWYTFVPDESKNNGRKLIKRKTKVDLENYLVAFYKDYYELQTIEKTYNEWVQKKIKFDEISKQTVDRYNTDFDKFFKEYKDTNIKCVTEDFLDDFIINNIKKYNLKAKAWSNLRILIRGIFLFAKKRGYTNINIILYLQELDLSKKIFNHDKKPEENIIYSEQEVEKIIEYLSDSSNLYDLAILFAIYTGMRVGEIVALKWEDINKNYIHVNRTQIRYKDTATGRMIYEIRDFPKTEAGIRDIVIVSELNKIIKKLHSINPFSEYVFNKNGECIKKCAVRAKLYRICEKLGFPKKGMHGFRRYFATKLINAGIEESIIISQMGHTDFLTTKSFYYKNNKDKEYIYNQVSKAISF